MAPKLNYLFYVSLTGIARWSSWRWSAGRRKRRCSDIRLSAASNTLQGMLRCGQGDIACIFWIHFGLKIFIKSCTNFVILFIIELFPCHIFFKEIFRLQGIRSTDPRLSTCNVSCWNSGMKLISEVVTRSNFEGSWYWHRHIFNLLKFVNLVF